MTDIIPLAKDDFENWLPLWRDDQAFYNVDLPEGTTGLTLARPTGGQEPMGGSIARNGLRAVGMAHWVMHRSCWRSDHSCYLEDLYVAQDVRGGGAGRRLIEAVAKLLARLLAHARDERAGDASSMTRSRRSRGFLHYLKRHD
jgi:GNAT superfamily N-acetyltransferase